MSSKLQQRQKEAGRELSRLHFESSYQVEVQDTVPAEKQGQHLVEEVLPRGRSAPLQREGSLVPKQKGCSYLKSRCRNPPLLREQTSRETSQAPSSDSKHQGCSTPKIYIPHEITKRMTVMARAWRVRSRSCRAPSSG